MINQTDPTTPKEVDINLKLKIVPYNRLLPKCNDRYKQPKRPFSLENCPISALFFEVKNVLNFPNSSRQYSVNGKQLFSTSRNSSKWK